MGFEEDPISTRTQVVHFGRDTTIRWRFRQGDYLIWVRFSNPLTGSSVVSILDIWELRDGDSAILTNRLEDIPRWFALHPLEAVNSVARKLLLAREPPSLADEVTDGPNVWRVRAGDRLAWVGPPHSELQVSGGMIAIVECTECLLALGEPLRVPSDPSFFGALSSDVLPQEVIGWSRSALAAITQLGLPREWCDEWLLR